MSIEIPVLPDLRMTLAAPDVEAALEVATLLADRARLGILALLREGPVCVCEMAAALGERQNNVSYHLARLRAAGLVRPSRHRADSRRVYYERDEAALSGSCGRLQRGSGSSASSRSLSAGSSSQG